MARWQRNALAAAVGLSLDALLGDPPNRAHPVAWFGSAMNALERRLWSDSRLRGVAYCGVGVAAGAVTGAAVRSVAASTAVSVAGRMLGSVAVGVATPLVRGDLDGARAELPSLVGRRASGLGTTEVARATIESVAENSVDAVVAPLFWAVVAGAPGTLAYRAVNTLDAMVGHHNDRYEHFGWASARLDDAANLVAARVTAALTLAPLGGKRQLAARVRAEARRHPSPNGGLIEAAFAHRLGIVIGGVNRYHGHIEDRGTLGTGRPPVPTDINRAVALRRRVCRQLAWLLLGIEAGFTLFRATRKPSGPRRHTLKHVERHFIP